MWSVWPLNFRWQWSQSSHLTLCEKYIQFGKWAEKKLLFAPTDEPTDCVEPDGCLISGKWCLDSTVLSAEDYHTHTQRRRTVTADRFLISNELISNVAASWSSDCHLCVSVIKQHQVRWCRRKQISIVLLLVTDLLKTCFVQKQSAGGSSS